MLCTGKNRSAHKKIALHKENMLCTEKNRFAQTRFALRSRFLLGARKNRLVRAGKKKSAFEARNPLNFAVIFDILNAWKSKSATDASVLFWQTKASARIARSLTPGIRTRGQISAACSSRLFRCF
jgi:hypothetical protein